MNTYLKRLIAALMTVLLLLSFAGCSRLIKGLRYQFKLGVGPTEEQRAEIDVHVAELREKLTEKVWHDADDYGEAYIFHGDGSVDYISTGIYTHSIKIKTTEPDNWYVGYTDEYEGRDVNDCLPEDIEEKFDYYIHYDGWRDRREHALIRFDENGDLWLWDTRYVEGDMVPTEMPADAAPDPALCEYIWHAENNASVDQQWQLYEDGTGIESSGMLLGELIGAGGFYWGVKDGVLYIDWNWDDPESCWWTDEFGNEYLRLETFTITEDTENGLPRYTLQNTWSTDHTIILTPSTDFNLSQEYEDMLSGNG